MQDNMHSAETTWFHVFKSMIENGDAARMGGTVFLVYCVIKSYTNFKSGASFPSVERIAERSGVSNRQVIRALQTLEENGYLTKNRVGRNNTYTLREKVTMTDTHGRPTAVATWDYLPATVEAARAELRHFILTGDDKSPQVINIEKLVIEQINVISGDHNTQFNVGNITDPVLREKVVKMLGTVDKSKTGDMGVTHP